MEYLLKLAVIITLLHIGLLQLMHFNDLNLLFKYFTLLFDTGACDWKCDEYLLIVFSLLSIYTVLNLKFLFWV